MKKIAVTGGSGGAGRYAIDDLLAHDYEVLNLDQQAPEEEKCPFIELELTNYPAVRDATKDCDAVIAMAANPEPDFDFDTGAERFRNNTLCIYNAFQAAVANGMEKVVWASSETTLGFPFENNRPVCVPVDETHDVQPQNSYALSKVVCEELARQMNKLYGIPFLGLRYSNIHFTGTWHSANYDAIPSYWDDLTSRKFNLWGYIDARDAASVARLALESDVTTAEVFNIAAADTIMNSKNQDLVDAAFPGLEITAGTGDYETLISITKARDMLGWTPQYSWRDVISAR